VKNQNVKLNALIKDAKCSTVQNVSLFANNPIASLIVKHQNQNANQFAKNPNVTGNAINLNVLNLNVNWYAKILIAFQKLNAAPVLWELLELVSLSHSLKKLKKIKIAVNANINREDR
jgi:hypothetical protein